MFTRDTDSIRARMNLAGQYGQPFLFGVDFELSEGFFIANPARQQDILYRVLNEGNAAAEPTGLNAELQITPGDPKVYQEKFDCIMAGLQRGDSFLANLTVKTPITTPLSLEQIFRRGRAPYQLYVPERFTCFSPERFVAISAGRISTNPMKGTIDAGLPDAERRILEDFKETAEHNTIVDLLRNDLSMVADNVRVSRFRYIDRIRARDRDILQVSSEIHGDLPDDYQRRLGDIIFRMLPAGSICGAPKASTLRLIRKAEGEPRGFYTGIFGYFDGRDFDSAVMIRFIEEHQNQLFFRSGGGITAYSDRDDEYRETLHKIYLPTS